MWWRYINKDNGGVLLTILSLDGINKTGRRCTKCISDTCCMLGLAHLVKWLPSPYATSWLPYFSQYFAPKAWCMSSMHQTSLCHTPFLDKWVCPVRGNWNQNCGGVCLVNLLQYCQWFSTIVASYQKFLTTYTLVSKTPLNFIQMLKYSYHFKNLWCVKWTFFWSVGVQVLKYCMLSSMGERMGNQGAPCLAEGFCPFL